jgi:hypothetical protein
MSSPIERLTIPYPPGISPDLEQARAQSLRWLTVQGLITDPDVLGVYDRIRTDRLAGRAYPNARGADLDLISSWMGWFFVFDDQFDGPLGQDVAATAAVIDELLRIVDAQQAPVPYPDALLGRAFLDLWTRSAAGMSPQWTRRSAGNWAAYLAAHRQEAVDRRHGVPGDLDTFLATWRVTVGLQPSLDLVERVGGFEVPPAIHDSEPVRRLREITGDVVLIVNDIFSAAKEQATGEMHNLVLLRRRDRRCGDDEAIGWAVDLVHGLLAAFCEEESRLRSGVLTVAEWGVLDRYVTGMKDWMRGNLDWSAETARYSGAGTLRSAGGAWPWQALLNT